MHKGCAQPNLKFWLFIDVNAITQQPTRAKKRDLNIMKINNLQENLSNLVLYKTLADTRQFAYNNHTCIKPPQPPHN